MRVALGSFGGHLFPRFSLGAVTLSGSRGFVDLDVGNHVRMDKPAGELGHDGLCAQAPHSFWLEGWRLPGTRDFDL